MPCKYDEMNGNTHILIGAAAGAALATTSGADGLQAIYITGAAAAAALLPDTDLKLRRLLPIKHRGPTHSLTALALVTLTALAILPPIAAAAIAIGFASHMLADMTTKHGIMLLWPARRAYRLIPRRIAISTGRRAESIIAILAAVILAILSYGYVAVS
jgi:inner membrane protein